MALFIDGEYVPQPGDGVEIISDSLTVRVGDTKVETHASTPIEVKLAPVSDEPDAKTGWFKWFR